MGSKYTIGIDLGTTYCSVAVFENGIVKVLEDGNGNRRVPSYVAFTDHECLVGFSAKTQASENPTNTIYGVKRLLGRKFDDPVVAYNTKYWPFSVIDEKGKPKIEVQYKNARASFFPEEITAMLLTRMKEIAESYIGTSGISDAVISVPANFNYLQRMATVHAARISGLEVSRLINEPTAAALAYCTEKKITGTHNLLVFAVGGGSFDVSIVSMKNGILQVKAVSGESHFGGQDFDNNLLMNHMPIDLKQNETTDITKKRLFARFKNACERAKMDLSKLPRARIEVEGCDNSIDVNREDFAKYNDELYSKMKSHVDKLLEHGRSIKVLKHKEVVDLLLVGGSTRLPNVEEMLKSNFSRSLRISKGINPDEAVMYGAVVQAALLHGYKSDAIIHLREVQDITPRSLYISLKDNIMQNCIPSSKIPTEGTLITFKEKQPMQEFSICETSQNTEMATLESFKIQINDSKPTSQWDVHIGGVRLFIDVNGILTFERLNAEIVRDQNFISDMDIKTMQDTAKKINDDCKGHQELMQCRNKLEGCIISMQAEFESIRKKSSKINEIMNECDTVLKWMSSDEGASKEEYERKQEDLQSIRKKVQALVTNNSSSASNDKGQPAIPISSTTAKYAIGIDLGTTYCSVAVFRNGIVEVLKDGKGNSRIPSCVAFTDDEILVGYAAKSQMAMNPSNTVHGVKRLIGRKFDDPVLKSDIKYWPFTVVSSEGWPEIQVQYKKKSTKFCPEQITALVLTKMKEMAELYIGISGEVDVVISVPANFNNLQRKATIDAARIAGLNVLQLINEPTAAAIAYGMDAKIQGQRNVLIFDLGGGTFDVSIVTFQDNNIKVKAVAGDTRLGGDDIVRRLVDYCVMEIKKTHKDISSEKAALSVLKMACEELKRELSVKHTASIHKGTHYKGIAMKSNLSRSQFDELNKDLFNKTMTTVHDVLRDAKMNKSDINNVLLVGGSTRITKIQASLQEFFGGEKLSHGINPDEAVSYGAAVYAAQLQGDKSDTIKNLHIHDVTPFPLGIKLPGGFAGILIQRNTTIPANCTVTFNTCVDYQTNMTISVCVGELAQFKDNNLLGNFHLSGLPAKPKGAVAVDITFAIDASGTLNVFAIEKSSNAGKIITHTNFEGQLSKDQIERMMKEAAKYKVDCEQKQNLKVFISKIEFDVANKFKNTITSADKQNVLHHCKRIIQWLKTEQMHDVSEYQNKEEELRQIWTKISANL